MKVGSERKFASSESCTKFRCRRDPLFCSLRILRRPVRSIVFFGDSGRKRTLSVDGICHSERKITLSTDWIQEKRNGKWTPCFFGDSAQIQGFLRSKFCFRAPKSMAAEVPAVAPDPEVPGGTGRRSRPAPALKIDTF